jgi:hypothetical protein
MDALQPAHHGSLNTFLLVFDTLTQTARGTNQPMCSLEEKVVPQSITTRAANIASWSRYLSDCFLIITVRHSPEPHQSQKPEDLLPQF